MMLHGYIPIAGGLQLFHGTRPHKLRLPKQQREPRRRSRELSGSARRTGWLGTGWVMSAGIWRNICRYCIWWYISRIMQDVLNISWNPEMIRGSLPFFNPMSDGWISKWELKMMIRRLRLRKWIVRMLAFRMHPGILLLVSVLRDNHLSRSEKSTPATDTAEVNLQRRAEIITCHSGVWLYHHGYHGYHCWIHPSILVAYIWAYGILKCSIYPYLSQLLLVI